MKAKYRRMVDTRRLYAWEGNCQAWPDSFLADTPIKTLRRFARKVWIECAPLNKQGRMPAVVAGRGTPHGGMLTSYCLGFNRIVLARQHRSKDIVLHELVHALGPITHGERFAKVYMRLLERYLPKAFPVLALTAQAMKVRGI